MYGVIRRYNVAQGAATHIAQRVNEEFIPTLREMPGFISYYVISPSDDTVVSISIFDDRAGADASTRTATDWVRRNLHPVIRTAPVIVAGEVMAYVGAEAPR